MMALGDDDDEEVIRETPTKVSFEKEQEKAANVKKQARKLVGNVLADARMGKQVALEQVNDAVQEMADSMFRNPDAILSLSLIMSVTTL